MAPTYYANAESCVEKLIQDLGKDIVLGLPLGLGKANQLANELYRRAKADASIKLRIVTALSLVRPGAAPGLERQFLEPVFERIFAGYVGPDYALDVERQCVPPNIQVSEFYVQPGSITNNDSAQQHYLSCNYTHVAAAMIRLGVNLIFQQVCKGEYRGKSWISLSSNTDVTLDLIPLIRQQKANGRDIRLVGMINQQLPFMLNDALCEPSLFDIIVDNPDYYTTLFAPPNMPVSATDFAIGMHASSLIRDAGTLQIGIGSLGDAIVYSCLLRQHSNAVYREAIGKLGYANYASVAEEIGGLLPFETGLYGSSEMLVNGFLHLMRAGILKRRVYDNYFIQKLVNEGRMNEQLMPENLDDLVEAGFFADAFNQQQVAAAIHFGVFNTRVSWKQQQLFLDDKPLGCDPRHPETLALLRTQGMGNRLRHGVVIHAGFFLGPKDFYDALHRMPVEEREAICMTGVGHVNQLLVNETLVIEQRQHARFINTGLMATVSGAVVSDALDNGKVISGVGGQFDFVTMAHTLPGARSILLIRSTRASKQGLVSNIVYNYGHITIPRHLRDIVVTEYGVADLRAKTDSEVIMAMLNITDSRFQMPLLEEAKRNGKIPRDYQIPQQFQNNFPERVSRVIEACREQGFFPTSPLGSDFTEKELIIGACLKQLKGLSQSRLQLAVTLLKTLGERYDKETSAAFLERMALTDPDTLVKKIQRQLFLHVLKKQMAAAGKKD